jgi:hypothetical protein
MDKLRTEKQNKALHKMFEILANELNDSGLYVGQVIRFDAPWNKDRVKELIWRETQKFMTGKTSTTELTTKEIDQIFEVIHKGLADKGIQIDFPSMESQLMEMRTQ